jgi:hypothetical protein
MTRISSAVAKPVRSQVDVQTSVNEESVTPTLNPGLVMAKVPLAMASERVALAAE